MTEFEMMKGACSTELQTALPGLMASVELSRDELAHLQTQRLRALLNHAKKNSPWHAARLAKVDPERFELKDLSALPIMTKVDAITHFDSISTDRKVTRAWCESYLSKDNPYTDGTFIVLASGGSSGLRGLQVYTPHAAAQFFGACIRLKLRHAKRTGVEPALVDATIMAAPGAAHGSQIITGLFLPISSKGRMSVTDPIDEIVNQLNEMQPRSITLYSSFVRHLTISQKKGALNIKPDVIQITSETPNIADLSTAKELWGCSIESVWGSTEGGVMGISSGFEEGHLLCDDLLIIEAVDEMNQPVPADSECAKVLITNLNSDTIPLIRYEMTDQITVYSKPAACGSGFRAASFVNGRLDDEFVYENGLHIHPHLFRHVLGQRPDIIEYQVTQTRKGARISLVAASPPNTDEIYSNLRRDLAKLGLVNPEVDIEVVSSIERTAAQKLKRFVPLSK
jgi:phenylacetate-coenzyme A ligase PaaK-like adenylate-forming protein